MQIKSSFKNITEMLPKQSSEARHSRHKRIIPYLIGLAAAAIVGAIVGTYFGPYNQAQLDALPLLDSMDLLLHIDSSHP
jgi:hypothetical protein